MTDEFGDADTPVLERAIDEFLDAGERVERPPFGALPEKLFHFTDAQGLIGVLKTQKLFASLAVTLNDPSETKHAIEVCRELLSGAKDPYRQRINFLLSKEAPARPSLAHTHAYVVSFCAADDLAFHWLHYGRNGRGFAVHIAPTALHKTPFELVPVLYDVEVQKRWLQAIVDAVERPLLPLLARTTKPTLLLSLAAGAASIAVEFIRQVAASMKHPSFHDEKEWRLIAIDRVSASYRVVPDRVHFRDFGARVVPFIEYQLPEHSIREIVIGFSNPMDDDDEALWILWRQALEGTPQFRRSKVPVR